MCPWQTILVQSRNTTYVLLLGVVTVTAEHNPTMIGQFNYMTEHHPHSNVGTYSNQPPTCQHPIASDLCSVLLQLCNLSTTGYRRLLLSLCPGDASSQCTFLGTQCTHTEIRIPNMRFLQADNPPVSWKCTFSVALAHLQLARWSVEGAAPDSRCTS